MDLNDPKLLDALAVMRGESAEQEDETDEPEPSGHDIEINPEVLLQKSLVEIQHLIEDFQLDPRKPRPGRGPAVTIGFDTEYVADDDAQEQKVLSYQFYLIGPEGRHGRIFYPASMQREHRLRLDDMLRELIQEAMEAGAIDEFPKRINLAAFFLRVDLATLADFDQFKRQLSNISGRLGSGQSDVRMEPRFGYLDYAPDTKTYITQGDDGFLRTMIIHFVDIGSHTPEGSNLASIGEALGTRKGKLPKGYSIERMDILLAENQPAFEAYAMRDAEIAAKFYVKLTALAKEISKIIDLPSTASNHGVALLRQTLKEKDIDFNEVFGLKDHTPVVYDEENNRLRRGKTEKVRINRRDMYERFITKCYHGGRNECFMAGPTEAGVFNDFDLAGAYTTGMVDFPVLDYSRRARIPESKHEFVGHVVGFAHVRFQYPAETRFPALPVESDSHGLIFPLSGESYCTAPEIEVAINQGCDITILDGVIFDQAPASPRVFEPFVTRIRELRKKYKDEYKASKSAGKPREGLQLWEKYVKLVGNGLYGKTAQGLKAKRVFEAGELKHVELPPSPITYAACAAHVTGFIRAVISEILDKIPPHRTVVSVTADGFLTDATEEEIKKLCCDGPLARRFEALCQRVASGTPMLEPKHEGAQILAMKTRGQLTASGFDDKPIILAKGSVSPPIKAGDDTTPEQFKALQNEYMVDLYLNRHPGQRTIIRPFVSLRDQMVHSRDVIRLSRSVRLNLEFDFKRKPVDPVMRDVRGQNHIAFGTKPWDYAGEVDQVRALFDQWAYKNCLKTLDDWKRWEDFRLSSSSLSALRQGKRTNINLTGKGGKGLFLNTFVRAYVRNLWGTQKTKSYAALAKWLNELMEDFPEQDRIEFQKHDITYAARKGKEPVEGCCPRTPDNEYLLEKLMEEWPDLKWERFFLKQ